MLSKFTLNVRFAPFQSHSPIRKMNKVAVCQVTMNEKKESNLKTFKSLVERASNVDGVKLIFFPEAVDYIALSPKNSVEAAESLDGPTMTAYKVCAVKHNVWLSIGGFHEKNELQKDRIYNSHVIINNSGTIVGIYRKMHLFDLVNEEKNINLKESSYVAGGNQIAPPVETPVGKLGLSICYDLRYPELSTCLRKLGAEILTYPSAFTVPTGAAHWEVLLRARAIENQCYVIASAQYGKHNEERQSFGNAMIVDPWGRVLAQCDPFSADKPETDSSFVVATIDLSAVRKIRKEMPVLEHRRDDIYSLNVVPRPCDNIEDFEYKFAMKVIPNKTVFYKSAHSFAFTNIRCVVPGHVLISSLRVAPKLPDLSAPEIADLFQTAQKVQRMMEKLYQTNSTTICVQDGVDAGQTVPHVHIHVLPRRKGDFDRNDDIYDCLAKHDRDSNPEPIRSLEKMIEEAATLRKYIQQDL